MFRVRKRNAQRCSRLEASRWAVQINSTNNKPLWNRFAEEWSFPGCKPLPCVPDVPAFESQSATNNNDFGCLCFSSASPEKFLDKISQASFFIFLVTFVIRLSSGPSQCYLCINKWYKEFTNCSVLLRESNKQLSIQHRGWVVDTPGCVPKVSSAIYNGDF